MAKKADYVVQYRRKREGKTDYMKRLGLLKSKTTRLVVRPSNKHITAQLIDYRTNGDMVISSANSKELKKFGWNAATGNTPAAYLTGLLCGLRGQKKGIKKAVLDIGLLQSIKGSRRYAVLKGAMDSGLKIPADEGMFPDEKRISGEHIAQIGKENITKEFTEVREKLTEAFKNENKKRGN
ncbi:MAG: 50S ribosomal protein L18 [Candidatus Altiarchaeota archaeon]|nr:50S ribosomal protein L18 [Candidatus Altiarchaeota archaeon]